MAVDERSERRELEASLDATFALLADERRRDVVRYFRDAEHDVASLSQLADYRVDRPNGAGDLELARTALHHAGLPKLADAGVVQYDARSETVRYEGAPMAERCLAAVESVAEPG